MNTGEVIALIKAFCGGGGGSSGGGVLVVNMVSDETGELDKTWKEISDAGFSVLKQIDGAETVFAVISSIGYDAGDNQYYVTYGDGSFVANSQTDYPAWS
jgi:hypothetical protein